MKYGENSTEATNGIVLYSSTSRTLWLYGQNLIVYKRSRPDCNLGHSSPGHTVIHSVVCIVSKWNTYVANIPVESSQLNITHL